MARQVYITKHNTRKQNIIHTNVNNSQWNTWYVWYVRLHSSVEQLVKTENVNKYIELVWEAFLQDVHIAQIISWTKTLHMVWSLCWAFKVKSQDQIIKYNLIHKALSMRTWIWSLKWTYIDVDIFIDERTDGHPMYTCTPTKITTVNNFMFKVL